MVTAQDPLTATETPAPDLEPVEAVVETPAPELPDTSTEAVVEDDSLEGFLKREGLADSQATAGEVTEAVAELSIEEREAAAERRGREAAQAEVAASRSTENRQAQRLNFQNRTTGLRLGLARDGVDAAVIEKVVKTFADHNNDLTQLIPEDTQTAFRGGLKEALAKVDSGVDFDAYIDKGSAELFKAVQTNARTGYVSKKEADKMVVNALMKRDKELRDKNLLPGSEGSSTVSGNGSGGRVTYAQILRMTDAQIKALPAGVFDKAINGG